MASRVSGAALLLACVALSCEAKWTDVTTAYAGFEIREVNDTAQPFAAYVSEGSEPARGSGACEGVEFKAEQVPPRSERNVVYAWAVTSGAIEQCAASVSAPGVDLAIERSSSGFRTYNLGPVRVLSGADVVRGRLGGKDDLLLLEIELTEAAARRMFEFTKSRVGQRMAILVDGKVESAPFIAGPIQSSRLNLVVADRAEGAALLRRLTGT